MSKRPESMAWVAVYLRDHGPYRAKFSTLELDWPVAIGAIGTVLAAAGFERLEPSATAFPVVTRAIDAYHSSLRLSDLQRLEVFLRGLIEGAAVQAVAAAAAMPASDFDRYCQDVGITRKTEIEHRQGQITAELLRSSAPLRRLWAAMRSDVSHG